jgi:hypothetical protein
MAYPGVRFIGGGSKPNHFLATAELGNEVAYGKGRTIVQKFSLR